MRSRTICSVLTLNACPNVFGSALSASTFKETGSFVNWRRNRGRRLESARSRKRETELTEKMQKKRVKMSRDFAGSRKNSASSTSRCKKLSRWKWERYRWLRWQLRLQNWEPSRWWLVQMAHLSWLHRWDRQLWELRKGRGQSLNTY